MKNLLFAAAIGSLPAALAAQAIPLSSEFQVNTYTPEQQYRPSIASDGGGGFVVVWASRDEDGSLNGVFGQRFSDLGGKIGAAFPVNASTAGHQARPSVAADAAGNFVVVWLSLDGSSYGIFGQRFDSLGAKAGAEFPVNTYTTGNQSEPRVAADPAGNFTVVWQSNLQDGSGFGIFGQRFSGSGSKTGPEFQVNTFTTNDQLDPRLAADGAGNFVAVWTSDEGDGSQSGVFGQVFDRSGQKSGPEFQINSYTTGGQNSAAVAADPAGSFVVAWQSFRAIANTDILAQRFNSSGLKLGPEFQVNTYTTDYQSSPSVAVGRGGTFLVVWRGLFQDGTFASVFGQRFDRTGARIGVEFPVNTYTTGSQIEPVVVESGLGFVTAWTSSDQDGSDYGIFGRRQNFFAEPMRADAHGGSGTTSDLNGTIEPGETAVVETAWNISSSLGSLTEHLTGTVSAFSGPAGGIYLLPHTVADYGTLGTKLINRITRNCYDATAAHDCPIVTVAGTRPGLHWDATFLEQLSTNGGHPWKLHIGDSFSDVPRLQPFYRKIETILHAGITTGCGGTQYCPESPVPRNQMAIFLAKGIAGTGESVPVSGTFQGAAYDCSAGGNSLFLDVLPTDSFCRHVHYIGARNVTLGCNPATYCPSQNVTRDAMASFIAKALVAPGGGDAVPSSYTDPVTALSYSCNAGSPNLHFTDVPVGHSFCKHIHYLWAKGIVSGCSATQYCPADPVNRDAMAKFIANGFGLELYGP